MNPIRKILDLQEYKEYEKVLQESPFFDRDFYLNTYPDIKNSDMSPERHYLQYGWKENRRPSRRFDPEYYLNKYHDIPQMNVNPLIHFIMSGEAEGRYSIPPTKIFHEYGKFTRMDVITTPHTMYVAKLYQKYLNMISIECEIHIGELETYLDIPYIIICPQFVKKFPDCYIAVQMEQTVSSRWLTTDYYKILHHASLIMDYSNKNLEFFESQKANNGLVKNFYSRMFYLPVDYYSDYYPDTEENKKEYDVIFYGDKDSCERRRNILDALSKKFKIKICSEVFGDELYQELTKAKVLINIHYYENALLETTRLYETLSLNSCVIVSETSQDIDEVDRLKDFVDFVPIDDIPAMEERISYWLEHEEERKLKVKNNKKKLENRSNSFAFFFYRFLLAFDRITFDEFYSLAGNYLNLTTNTICLNLPESTIRKIGFEQENLFGFKRVPGLRHEEGWIGCAYSYKYIFMRAKAQGLENIIICEDDVVFKKQFSADLNTVQSFLSKQNHWDVFSGLMADIGNVIVSEVHRTDRLTFAKVNHMVSMVFNIYNKSVFDILASWNRENGNDSTNTIDRYLQKEELSIWTTYPFLVGYNEDLDSTIWQHDNELYIKMIEKSEEKLGNFVFQKEMRDQMDVISKQLNSLNCALIELKNKEVASKKTH